jgi:chromosome segregation ATPase
MTPEAPKARSFGDILKQNQEFIAHLQALQEDIGAQLEEKEKELAVVKRQLADKQQELDELQNAQLQWAMDRQALLDQHDSIKQIHQDLQQKHDQSQVELARLKEDVARGRARDEERRSQLRKLEQERIELAQKFEADQKKIRADLKSAQDDLDSLQTAQLQWAIDREALLKDRDSAVAKQAQLEQDWQRARLELTQDKAKLTELNSQQQQQLKAIQAEIEPLRAAREKWQAERQRLISDVARLEQAGQAAQDQFKADRKLLMGQLEEARSKAADLDRAEAEFQRLSDERSALLTKVKALEKDWQSREASIAEEKAALKKQVQDAAAKLAATQQDYEKLKALHADLADKTGRKAEEWTAREQRLTS